MLAVLAAVFGFLSYVIMRLRKGGGSLTTIAMGATDDLLTKDQSRAEEEVVERKANKKLQEQEQDLPTEDR